MRSASAFISADSLTRVAGDSRSRWGTAQWGVIAIMLTAIALPWLSAGDHALYPPDEGRYASASLSMADGGTWLYPSVGGQPHLTKPPLVYWMQATALRWIGHGEFAVRLPSLLASSAMTLLVWLAGARLGNRRIGVIAAALFACMPLQVVIGRMAIIDPVLAVFWFGALFSAVVAVQDRSTRAAVIVWMCIALGLMAKGPIALVPLLAIAAWLGLAGRWSAVWRLHPLIGFPLAATPVLIWAIAVARIHPEAVGIWFGQSAGRLLGEEGANSHVRPIWFYLPWFVGGLFPATMMFHLPGFHLSWRHCWNALRAGDERAFWQIAWMTPLLLITLMAGKLATYLLPLAGPVALIAATNLNAWIDRASPRPNDVKREWDPAWPLFIAATVLAIVMIGGSVKFRPEALTLALPAALPMIAAAWLIRCRIGSAQAKWIAAALLWFAGVIAWYGVMEFEDDARGIDSSRNIVQRAIAASPSQSPVLAINGFRDPCLEFYARFPVAPAGTARELRELLQEERERLVLLTDPEDWQQFSETNPGLVAEFDFVDRCPRWFGKSVVILRPRAEVSDATVARTPAP